MRTPTRGALIALWSLVCTSLIPKAHGQSSTRKFFAPDPPNIYLDAIEHTNSGGVVLAHSLSGNQGAIAVTSVGPDGVPIWAHRYFFGPGLMCHTNDVMSTSSGEIVVIGSLHDSNQYLPERFLMKLDPAGELLWCELIDCDTLNIEWGRTRLLETKDNGIQVMLSIPYILALMSFSSDGVPIWTSMYTDSSINKNPGLDMIRDGDSIVVSAMSAERALILKLDESGEVLWSRKFPDEGFWELNNVDMTDDGTLLFSGTADIHGAAIIPVTRTGQILPWHSISGVTDIEDATLDGSGALTLVRVAIEQSGAPQILNVPAGASIANIYNLGPWPPALGIWVSRIMNGHPCTATHFVGDDNICGTYLTELDLSVPGECVNLISEVTLEEHSPPPVTTTCYRLPLNYTLSPLTPVQMGSDVQSVEFCLSTGKEDRPIDQATIRPNPIDDRGIVQFREPLTNDSRIQLLDIHGRVMRSWRGDGTDVLLLDRNGLSGGAYVLSVLQSSGQGFRAHLILR